MQSVFQSFSPTYFFLTFKFICKRIIMLSLKWAYAICHVLVGKVIYNCALYILYPVLDLESSTSDFYFLLQSDVNTVCFADETGHLLYSGSDDNLCKVNLYFFLYRVSQQPWLHMQVRSFLKQIIVRSGSFLKKSNYEFARNE